MTKMMTSLVAFLTKEKKKEVFGDFGGFERFDNDLFLKILEI